MKKILLTIPIILFFIIGCTTQNTPPTTTNKKLKIVTSFYPLAFMTKEITGDKANVINLAGNQDAHDYQLSPQDMVKLIQADLIIFQGAKLEPWTDDLIPQLQNKKIKTLEVSHHINLAEIDETHKQEEDEKHNHHHGKFDPHTWLDPILAQDMINEITETLIKIDPNSKTIYENNANQLKNKFQKLDKKFQDNLSQCERNEVILSHDAFGYIAKRYNFIPHPISGLSTQDEPSAYTLAKIKEEAQEGITHILIEENKIQKFAETLAQETGLKTLLINPLEKSPNNNQDFFSTMESNLNSFKTALGCQ